MWNAYVLVMMILYAPPLAKLNKGNGECNIITFFHDNNNVMLEAGVGNGDKVKDQEEDPAMLQKLITKSSQE